MQIESEAMRFGTKMHLHLEEWLKFGKVPDYSPEGLAAVKTIKLLPPPSPGLSVEHKILEVLPDADAHGPATVYTGAIDLCDLRPVAEVQHWPEPAGMYDDEDAPRRSVPYRLLDHKSCASLQWSKKRHELEDDVSSTFYGREVMRRTGDKVIYSRWNYSERIGSKAEPRDFVLTADGVERRWKRTQQTVAEMRQLHYSQKDWTEVAGNYEHCGAYGGCQFRSQCSLQRNEEVAMGLLDHLKSGGEVGKGVATGSPASKPAEDTVPGMLEGTALGNSLAAMFKAGASASGAQPAAPVARLVPPVVPTVEAAPEVAPSKEEEQDLMEEGGEEPEGMNFGINPADAAPADLQKDTVEKRSRKKREKTLQDTPTVAPLPTAESVTELNVAAIATRLIAKRILMDGSVPTSKPGSLLERVSTLEAEILNGARAGASSENDLGGRIEALEQRICALEELVGK